MKSVKEMATMGAWGAGSFENDDASDWLNEFCLAPDETGLFETLLAATSGGYPEASECSEAVAAAEVVAWLNGTLPPDLSEEARESLEDLDVEIDGELVRLALAAVRRVRTSSELKEVWDESKEPGDWYGAMFNLETRLAG